MTDTIQRPRLVWLDLETTCLDPSAGNVLEIAMIVTEPDLLEVARFQSVFYAQEYELAQWSLGQDVRDMHAASGLLLGCANAQEPRSQTWLRAREFVDVHCGENQIMAGSSIHFDRSWLRQHQPKLLEPFHYRMIDVSGVRELLRSVGREVPDRASKPHRAMPDAEASLALGRWLAAGFKNATFPEGIP